MSASNKNHTTNLQYLEVEKKLSLDIAAKEVWSIIENYNGMTVWHPSIAKSDIIEGVNNGIGCNRRLIFLNGLELDERLTVYDPSHMTIEYDINRIYAKPFPVSHYTATLKILSESENRSTLVWKSKFKRKDHSDNPVANEDDQAGIDTIEKVYRVAFENIKKYIEDKKMITTQLTNYAQGATDGDKKRVEGAFKKNAFVTSIKEDNLVEISVLEFISSRVIEGQKQDRTFKIDFIEIKQNIASAKITFDCKTHQFVDYFTLIKDHNEWYIVSKVFTKIEKPV